MPFKEDVILCGVFILLLKALKSYLKMKILSRTLLILLMSLALGCSKSEDADVNNPSGNDPGPDPDPVELVTYNLTAVNSSGAAGTAKLIRNDDGTATIYIELTSAPAGLHPAAVHENSLEEGGPIAITLNACECLISETVITQLDDGTAITFDQLMVFDGYINIYQGTESMDNIIAHANIGSNAF